MLVQNNLGLVAVSWSKLTGNLTGSRGIWISGSLMLILPLHLSRVSELMENEQSVQDSRTQTQKPWEFTPILRGGSIKQHHGNLQQIGPTLNEWLLSVYELITFRSFKCIQSELEGHAMSLTLRYLIGAATQMSVEMSTHTEFQLVWYLITKLFLEESGKTGPVPLFTLGGQSKFYSFFHSILNFSKGIGHLGCLKWIRMIHSSILSVGKREVFKTPMEPMKEQSGLLKYDTLSILWRYLHFCLRMFLMS